MKIVQNLNFRKQHDIEIVNSFFVAYIQKPYAMSIDIYVNEVQFFTTSTGPKATVWLQALTGANAGIYRASGGVPMNTDGKPIVVFDLTTLQIERSQDNPFHSPGQEPAFVYPLINGQQYSFVNATTSPILFGILNGVNLVNSRTDGGSQSGDINTTSNYLTLNLSEQIFFTLDSSVQYPSLIEVSETLTLPPVGCCSK